MCGDAADWLLLQTLLKIGLGIFGGDTHALKPEVIPFQKADLARNLIHAKPFAVVAHGSSYHEKKYGWLSKFWSFFGVPITIRHIIFRVPKKGP